MALLVLPISRPARVFRAAPLALAIGLVFATATASAANFTISTPSTTAQTLNAGQTGTVTATGTLTVSGSTVAVTIGSSTVSLPTTLTNLGAIRQTGTGRVIRDNNNGDAALTINNGDATHTSALMQSADADVIQMNQAIGGVTLNNFGTMFSANASQGGSQAVDFSAITSGVNIVNNMAGAFLRASEADAVRPGVNGVVNNAGVILSGTAVGASSDGVDMQNNTGGVINNLATGLIEGGRHGITGGALNATVTFTTNISNAAGGFIQGDNGSGVNIDGFNAKELVTVNNAGSIIGFGRTGDGDGVDVDGLVSITNSGLIRSANAFNLPAAGPAFSEGISVGGGTITNSGTIEGLVAAGNTNALGRGITLVGNDILDAQGNETGQREAIYANSVVNNLAGGVIRGQNDSAIVVGGPASGFTVTINNAAGASMVGGSSTDAAIRTGFDNDTINNRGTINGSSSGRAIDLGAGNNTLNVLGGQAFILGDVSGGTGGTNLMTINPGAGNVFQYGGSISNFAMVDIAAGKTDLFGVSTYTGKTKIESGGTLVLESANRLSSASALDLAGGLLAIVGSSGIDGQTFSSLSLEASSLVDLEGAGLTFGALGTVDDANLFLIDWFGMSSLDYAIRFSGDLTGNAAFEQLLSHMAIDGHAARAVFDGTFTDVVAIPEPSELALMLGGLGLVGWSVRRKRARTA